MLILTFIFLGFFIVSGVIAYTATEPLVVLISRVIFSISVIALLAHISHPEII